MWITGVGFAGHRNGVGTLFGLKAICKTFDCQFFSLHVDSLTIYKTEVALRQCNLW